MALCSEVCAVAVMTVLDFHPHVLSVTEAAKSGLPKLLRDVEAGEAVVVERHCKPVAGRRRAPAPCPQRAGSPAVQSQSEEVAKVGVGRRHRRGGWYP